MYEIWLGLNIAYEIALASWQWLLPVLVLWLVLLLVARARLRQVRPAVLLAVGGLALVLTFMLLPGATRSSLADMGYWVDWMNLVLMSMGAGVAAMVLLWPVLAAVPGGRST